MHLQAIFPITNWTSGVCMNIDSGGYSEANSWYFLFMEQMHWQFISYSCPVPLGIHLFKLERCIGCLTISYACLSDGPHNHNCHHYTVIITTCFWGRELQLFPVFSGPKGRWGTWAGCPMSQEVHLGSLKTQTNSVVCWTSVTLSARVCEISCQTLKQ